MQEQYEIIIKIIVLVQIITNLGVQLSFYRVSLVFESKMIDLIFFYFFFLISTLFYILFYILNLGLEVVWCYMRLSQIVTQHNLISHYQSWSSNHML